MNEIADSENTERIRYGFTPSVPSPTFHVPVPEFEKGSISSRLDSATLSYFPKLFSELGLFSMGGNCPLLLSAQGPGLQKR